jgi:hypothetical protein
MKPQTGPMCSYPACIRFASRFRDKSVRHAADACFANPCSPAYDSEKHAAYLNKINKNAEKQNRDKALMASSDEGLRDFTLMAQMKEFRSSDKQISRNESKISPYTILLLIVLILFAFPFRHILHPTEKLPKLSQTTTEADTSMTDESHASMRRALMTLRDIVSYRENTWICDTGATTHMTYNREAFSEYRKVEQVKSVQFGDATTAVAVGRGTVKIGDLTLHNVLHVPSLRFQLLSSKQLIKDGSADRAIYEANCGKFIKNSKVVARMEIKEGLYILTPPTTAREKCLLLSKEDGKSLVDPDTRNAISQSLRAEISPADRDLPKWHHKLGHLNKKSLRKLNIQGNLPFCAACASAKICQKDYKRRVQYTAEILGKIHSDIQGPYILSVNLARHFITFVDECTRYVKVYIIRSRSEALSCYKKYCSETRNKFSMDICILRTDGALEYHSNEFRDWLDIFGTVHETTLPYLSATNGLAERINRTLLERARCFLAASGLGSQFWDTAVLYAAHTYNLSPHSSLLNNASPNDLWNSIEDTKIKRSNLEIYGTVCYAHPGYPHNHNPKVDQVGIRSLFLGINALGFQVLRLEHQSNLQMETMRTAKFTDAFLSSQELKQLKLDSSQIPETNANDPSYVPEESDSDSETLIQRVGEEELTLDNEKRSLRPKRKAAKNGENLRRERERVNENLALTHVVGAASDATMHRELTHTVGVSWNANEHHESLEQVGAPWNANKHSESSDSDQKNANNELKYLTEVRTPEKSNADETEPRNLHEGLNNSKWVDSMAEEMKSLLKNGTWELVDHLPPGKKAIPCKWVWKLKRNGAGEIERYKSRLVALGNHQSYLLDYDETFSPVINRPSLRYILNLAAKYDLDLWNMDVDTAFLNSYLEGEEIYMKQAPGFEDPTRPKAYCKLVKSIYGLKQANRVWNQNIDEFLNMCGFKSAQGDPCLYIKVNSNEGSMIVVGLYVDDLLIASNSLFLTEELKESLKLKYSMKDLGRATRILNMDIGYVDGANTFTGICN